ncbi:LLM class flavin-dependent oxidoreductase [Nocardia sp. NBC_00881]|uniref:LLM class flavin-dependent oxidoreductase n=1 Tax=Nocardia sp. NBC_00881 TaxID=2975995 RepID=UPI003865D75D|nr:LLM class flavin-dependent oxidoreductase [Nocardia sp. NBC_00881]
MKIGVILPSVATQLSQNLDLAAAARHAEQVGLAGVWHGDHLSIGVPALDCTIALAVAAAATERVHIGTSVYVPALRPRAWAAKQIATLQHVSGGRLLLGVGSGGGPAQWAAAGIPYGERGTRTDIALRVLPALLAGKRVTLPDMPEQSDIELIPPASVPPVWVGNHSTPARRRAAQLGGGWFPSLIPPAQVAAGLSEIIELAAQHQRPTPTVAIGATGVLGASSDLPTRAEIAAGITRVYGRSFEETLPIPITGSPQQAAERIAAYHDAGAHHLVMGIAGGNWRRQCELLAQARALLT